MRSLRVVPLLQCSTAALILTPVTWGRSGHSCHNSRLFSSKDTEGNEEETAPSSATRQVSSQRRGSLRRQRRSFTPNTAKLPGGQHPSSKKTLSHRTPSDDDGDALDRLPRSLDVSITTGIVDVEKFFPEAMAHLKSAPTSPHVAEQQETRRWHDATHALNIDGQVSHATTVARDRRENSAFSFFNEGSLDIRGSDEPLRESSVSVSERVSPDFLQLTGGSVQRHGAHLAERSNRAPADQTIEGDLSDDTRHEFGDTPAPLTDMLRERLMELKGEVLREERHETFLPRRLQLRSTVSAQEGGAGTRAQGTSSDPAMRSQATSSLLQQSHKPESSRGGTTTLADLQPEGVDADTADQAAILKDGIAPSSVSSALNVLRFADDYVPGATQRDESHGLPNSSLSIGGFNHGSGHSQEIEKDGAIYLLRTLPRAAFCSRREAVAIIASGQVHVNNVVERNPFRLVRAEDDIHVSGHPSRLRFAPPRLWMYHKPANVIVSRNDTAGRALITKHARILGMDHLIPVGSLPMRAHGILLLTNDGELSRFLEDPKSMIQRTYLLRVRPAIDPILAHKLNSEGINLNGRQFRGAEFFVNPAMKSRYSLKLKLRSETMPVSHLLQHLGRKIERGGRLSFGPFSLGGLAVGSIREVTVPPFYSQHLGSAWQPFVERDWPYFRRLRVRRLRRLCRYRELTPRELEELDNYSYEEVKDALSFESSELESLAAERAEQLARRPVLSGSVRLPTTLRSGDAKTGDITTSFGSFDDDPIVEDITMAT